MNFPALFSPAMAISPSPRQSKSAQTLFGNASVIPHKMRREELLMPKLISLALVFYSYFLIHTNISNLPQLIPTHFNAAGEADGWGSPSTLWILLGVQILTSVVFLCVPYLGQRFPQFVNLGLRKLSDYSPEQRLRILPLLHDMMGYMSIVTNLYFAFTLHCLIQAAGQPHPHLPVALPLGLLLGATLGLTFYYLRRIGQVAKETVMR